MQNATAAWTEWQSTVMSIVGVCELCAYLGAVAYEAVTKEASVTTWRSTRSWAS